ncbi:MAG: hypothetical protein HLUCCX10_03985 [Algoriphagus marincola HL-49]|uniref:Outer membrane protein beta-barrel domain n=1 Tax=Algoriphagus marincola HL-49 TaxID=1305737 RepID=A0A0P7XQ18_9BACT|nr:MAG: hypothetical protein HLUCCX10_03985 [Algoriphagus marincola HL-49]
MRIYFHQKLTFFVFLVSLISFSHATKAQRYGTALGLRVGNSDLSRTVGLTFEQRIQKRISAELILQSDFSRNTTFSALAKFHRPIISKRFNYYLGAGPAIGNEESFRKIPETRQIVHSYGNSTFGLDMIAGLELTVANAVISLDYKPNINIAGREEFFRGQVGISARTVLVKSKEQKKRAKRRQKAKKANSSEKNSFWEKLKIGPAY